MEETTGNELEITPEIIMEFACEAEEHLLKAESALLAMETRPADKEELNRAFRSFHTMKGSADYLGFKALKDLLHFCEGILDQARSGCRAPEGSIMVWLIKAVDGIKSMLKVNLCGAGAIDTINLEKTARIFFENMSAGIITGINLARTQDDGGSAVDLSGGSAAELRPALKVDAYKFNSMMNSLNELAVAETAVRNELKVLEDKSSWILESLKKKVAALGRISTKLNYDSAAMKMIEFQHLFNKMKRLVRDLSVKSDKKLKLLLNGGDTEIDREIMDNLSEPLIHIIRNAVDHGIEPLQERALSGKPPAGMISLSAFCRDGGIVVTVSDDGRGLDKKRIAEKAEKAGLYTGDDNISDEKAGELIMTPGFSTAEKVSELSGRGVGMDVVRKAVEILRGSMKIKSIKGQGTKITMTFPVNMAVIEGLTVSCGNSAYVIPVANVVSVGPADENEMQEFGNGAGEIRDMLFCRFDGKSARKESLPGPARKSGRGIAVNIGIKGDSLAMYADKVVSQQKITVKNIPGFILEKTIFSGATLLPDGRPAMIISPERLFGKY